MVAAGRLMPSKRFDELVRIASRGPRGTCPTCSSSSSATATSAPNLEAQVAELGAEGWVRIAGKVSDEELLSLYRRAWVVASASIAEGWGMTLTEAAACGTPSVATDIAGHRDSVAAGQSGLLAADDRAFVRDLTRCSPTPSCAPSSPTAPCSTPPRSPGRPPPSAPSPPSPSTPCAADGGGTR